MLLKIFSVKKQQKIIFKGPVHFIKAKLFSLLDFKQIKKNKKLEVFFLFAEKHSYFVDTKLCENN